MNMHAMQETQQPPSSGLAEILRVSRAVMLMEPMAEAFNDIPVVAPVRRVMLVAEALAGAAGRNASLDQIIRDRSAISHLREEARRRGSGDVVMPRAFQIDFERAQEREGGHA